MGIFVGFNVLMTGCEARGLVHKPSTRPKILTGTPVCSITLETAYKLQLIKNWGSIIQGISSISWAPSSVHQS